MTEEQKANFIKVAEYIVSCDGREYEDYVTYCDDNELDPADLRGTDQAMHVYAQALIALELEFSAG